MTPRPTPADLPAVLVNRAERVRQAMDDAGIEALALSLGADLVWLTGYEAMPLERLTMLVFPTDDLPTLVVPRLELPRVNVIDEAFRTLAWDETDDPVGIVAELLGQRSRVAVGDRTWARFLVELQRRRPGRSWSNASEVTGHLRAVKDPHEIDALRRAARAADRVAAQLQAGEVALLGRTEAQVSRDLADRLIDEGHDRVNFAIVASGPNGASPHHHPGSRVVIPGDLVLCDFGGTLDGYCSDISRTVAVGEPSDDQVEVHAVVARAQYRAVDAARPGASGAEVDGAARSVIAAAGYGDYFVHRTGHGIGLEEHEEPYIVVGNTRSLEVGNAFSVEPGIYLPGRFGVRIEDIVVVGDDGPERLNTADRDLFVLS